MSVAKCDGVLVRVEFFFIMQSLQRLLIRWYDRYGAGLTLLILVLLSYLAFTWIVNVRGDRVAYRASTSRSIGAPAVLSLLPAGQRGLNHFDEIYLHGTISNPGGTGSAVVSLGEQRKVLSVGDPIGRWTVEGVDIGLLTISNGGETHTLSLLRDSLLGRELRRRGFQVAVERLTAKQDFRALRWYTIPLGGEFVGMRLEGMGDRVLASTFGLYPGDTVESVNGLPVTPGFQDRMAERLRRDELIRLGLRREGRLLNVTYTLHD